MCILWVYFVERPSIVNLLLTLKSRNGGAMIDVSPRAAADWKYSE
jgi:hypothetical protein